MKIAEEYTQEDVVSSLVGRLLEAYLKAKGEGRQAGDAELRGIKGIALEILGVNPQATYRVPAKEVQQKETPNIELREPQEDDGVILVDVYSDLGKGLILKQDGVSIGEITYEELVPHLLQHKEGFLGRIAIDPDSIPPIQ